MAPGRQHAVRNGALEDGLGGVVGVEMNGVLVARHLGERDDVGFADRLGEGCLHADFEVLEMVGLSGDDRHQSPAPILRMPRCENSRPEFAPQQDLL